MKKLEGLTALIINIRTGQPILVDDGMNMTIRDGLVFQLTMHQSGALEAIRVHEIANKLLADKTADSVELEDSQITALKGILEANPGKMFSTVLSQVYKPFV
jgi:hypothetical protein